MRFTDYDCMEDAPDLHKRVVNFASSGMISAEGVATLANLSVQAVNTILSYPPVVQELERRELMRASEQMQLFDDMGNLRKVSLEKLLEIAHSGKMSVMQLVKVFEMTSSRHPDRATVPQTKQLNEGAGGRFKKGQLSALRARAELPVNVSPFVQASPLIVEAADGFEDAENG